MNLKKFETIGMLLVPIVIFLGIVIAIVFKSRMAYLPFWMIAIIIAGFIASCIIIFFTVMKIIKNINSKDN